MQEFVERHPLAKGRFDLRFDASIVCSGFDQRFLEHINQGRRGTFCGSLAVVCDADQVIHASLDKHDGNRVRYVSGAIENPEINKLLVNILEGTRPAFDNRDRKYQAERTGLRRRFPLLRAT